MYIEKIFSEESSNEKLYSVLMDEEELTRYYSFMDTLKGYANKVAQTPEFLSTVSHLKLGAKRGLVQLGLGIRTGAVNALGEVINRNPEITKDLTKLVNRGARNVNKGIKAGMKQVGNVQSIAQEGAKQATASKVLRTTAKLNGINL